MDHGWVDKLISYQNAASSDELAIKIGAANFQYSKGYVHQRVDRRSVVPRNAGPQRLLRLSKCVLSQFSVTQLTESRRDPVLLLTGAPDFDDP